MPESHARRAPATTHELGRLRRRFRPYVLDIHAAAGASFAAAVAEAAHDVLVALIPLVPAPAGCPAARLAIVEAHYAAALAAIPNGPAKTQRRCCRGGGGRRDPRAPGRRRIGHPAPGSRLPAGDQPWGVALHARVWRSLLLRAGREVTPFVLRDPAQFRASRPYNLKSKKYAEDFNEVKTPRRQRRSASGPRTRPRSRTSGSRARPCAGIASRAPSSTRAGFGVWENARLFALLNAALADGYIGSWETKYRFNFLATGHRDSDGRLPTATVTRRLTRLGSPFGQHHPCRITTLPTV